MMTKLHLKAAALLALGVAMTACGHHDHDRSPGNGNTDPPVATDAFVTYVAQQTATQDDTGEPLSTDGVNVTTPETSEPSPLPGS
jgi:hypothetical protein